MSKIFHILSINNFPVAEVEAQSPKKCIYLNFLDILITCWQKFKRLSYGLEWQ